MVVETYESLREWKDQNVMSYLKDTISLNDFHDQIMQHVMCIAKCKLKDEPPCDFTWFITGSGGRSEQGIISDQDHGIIYEKSGNDYEEYFKALGEELAFGLHVVGYPYCHGNVMSSNPLWCKSADDWKIQLEEWMREESWEAIRHLQIFFDARMLCGNQSRIHDLKLFIYHFQLDHSSLLQRFSANIKHVKNVIGPLGQILVEQHGFYQGCVNIKYAAFLPYVNAVRLLSIKEGIYETSTLDRMNQLIRIKKYEKMLKNCERNFLDLLKYRVSLMQIENYTDTQYLRIRNLSTEERKEIKRILKDGKRLHEEVMALTS